MESGDIWRHSRDPETFIECQIMALYYMDEALQYIINGCHTGFFPYHKVQIPRSWSPLEKISIFLSNPSQIYRQGCCQTISYTMIPKGKVLNPTLRSKVLLRHINVLARIFEYIVCCPFNYRFVCCYPLSIIKQTINGGATYQRQCMCTHKLLPTCFSCQHFSSRIQCIDFMNKIVIKSHCFLLILF